MCSLDKALSIDTLVWALGAQFLATNYFLEKLYNHVGPKPNRMEFSNSQSYSWAIMNCLYFCYFKQALVNDSATGHLANLPPQKM